MTESPTRGPSRTRAHVGRVAAKRLRVRPKQFRARRFLDRIDRDRIVIELLEAGSSQMSVAADLGISQATVHRIASHREQVEQDREDPSPAEVIARCWNAQITRAEMMADLLARSYREGSIPEHSHDAYTRGTWDQIREAYLDELITAAEFKQLQDRHYG